MSRQLRTLLKQNRALEEKLFYEPSKVDWQKQLITQQELSSAITFLCQSIRENTSDTLCVLTMLNNIEKIHRRPLAAYEKSALQVVQLIFNYLRKNSNFNEANYHVLNSLQLAFTRLSLNDLSFIDNEKHPAIIFLNKLVNLDKHFDKDAGELAQFFNQAIELLVDRLANQENVNNNMFSSASKKLDEYYNSFNEKISNNINLIFNSLEKTSRQAQADHYTQQLISSKTDGEEMPVFLLDFMQNEISPILHKIIVENGAQSKPCQQLLTDLDTLTWSIIHPNSDEDYQKRFKNDVSDSMKRLYLLFENNQIFTQYVKDFFFEIETLQNKKLQGERIQYDVMISANIFADEAYENNELNQWDEPIKPAGINISGLEEGQWYQVVTKKITLNCQLLAIDELTKNLIFINLSGEQVLALNFETDSHCVDHIYPMTERKTFEFKNAIQATEKELMARFNILNNEYQNFLIKKAKNEEQDKKRQELEQKSREAIQHKIESEKKIEAIKQRELQRIREEQKIEEKRLDGLNAHQRFHVKSIYRDLVPGAQIAYKNESGKWQKLTLSLISETTQRYIFSDGSGRQSFQPNKKELNQLIDTLRLKVVKVSGESDPLQSLVLARRKKLQSL